MTFHLVWLKCPSGPHTYIRLSIIISDMFTAIITNILVITDDSTSGDVVMLAGTDMRGTLFFFFFSQVKIMLGSMLHSSEYIRFLPELSAPSDGLHQRDVCSVVMVPK